jgi:hypothetical protein
MEAPDDLRDSIFEGVESYSKTTFELLKLKAIESGISIATAMVSSMTVIVVISVFILILNIGIALFLGELVGKSYYGFFIVAMFYLILGVVFHFFLRKWLRNPVCRFIINQTLR